jgi:hypothetical protein
MYTGDGKNHEGEREKEGGTKERDIRDFIAMHGMSIRNFPYKRFRPIPGPIAAGSPRVSQTADSSGRLKDLEEWKSGQSKMNLAVSRGKGDTGQEYLKYRASVLIRFPESRIKRKSKNVEIYCRLTSRGPASVGHMTGRPLSQFSSPFDLPLGL